MKILPRTMILIILLALVAVFSGCGGGGGGGTASPEPNTLGLTATEPTLSGKTGQIVNIPVSISGTGSATTASFNLHFNSGSFEPVDGVTIGGSSVEITGTSSTVAARYKWVDAQTVKVLYASSVSAASGSIIISVPVKVKSETSSALAVQSLLIN